MCESLGYSRDELLTMHVYDFEMTVAKGQIRGIWSRMTPGIAVTIEGKHRRRDGTIFPVEVRLGLFGEGEGARVMTLCRDITERRRAEEARAALARELAEARDLALAASQAKSEFLANMSHELRTPLNAIIGYTELITEDLGSSGGEPLRPDLERIHGASLHLLGLISDILDLSKIEAGQVDLLVETIDLNHFLDEVIGGIRPLAVRGRNRLQVVVERPPSQLCSDRIKLRQVLTNLLGNACKFTEDGEITLEVRGLPEAADGGEPRVAFIVRDTGIGIPEARLEEIFHAFTQADASTTRRYGGTGLGLAISRHLCQLLGGQLTVASVVGEGSTFAVEIPAELDPAELDPAELDPAATESSSELLPEPAVERASAGAVEPRLERGVTSEDAPIVLVIDDDPAAHDLLARLLVREGLRIRSAYDGRQGIAYARAYRPAVILLDLVMPEIDGWEVFQALRAEPALATIPVVLSSVVEAEDRAYALGIDDCLTKPVRREALLEVLSRQLGRDEGTVLVVDDDPDAREVYRRGLLRTGWRVVPVAGGREALDYLERAPVDVVILDLMMPEIDGFEVVDRLRRDPRWADLPVVIASAMELSAAERERLQGQVAGIYGKGSLSLRALVTKISGLVGRS